MKKETFKLLLNSIQTSLFVLFVWEIRTFRFADYMSTPGISSRCCQDGDVFGRYKYCRFVSSEGIRL